MKRVRHVAAPFNSGRCNAKIKITLEVTGDAESRPEFIHTVDRIHDNIGFALHGLGVAPSKVKYK